MMTAMTLALALGVAVVIYMLRNRFLKNRRNDEQEAQVRQLEQRLVQIAQQGTEEVSLAVLQLEEKLDQANATIEELRYRTQLAEGLLWQREQEASGEKGAVRHEAAAVHNELLSLDEMPSGAEDAPAEQTTVPFAQKLAIAAYQLSLTGSPESLVDEEPWNTSAPVVADSLPAVEQTTSENRLLKDKTARYEQAARLLRAGKSEIETAKELDLGIGEVRLAKQLLPTKGA